MLVFIFIFKRKKNDDARREKKYGRELLLLIISLRTTMLNNIRPVVSVFSIAYGYAVAPTVFATGSRT